MSKEIYISSTPHETRLAIVENDGLAEIYYERENEYTLAGSIYNGRVTRVLPGMQSSFVDIGLERDAFLYITDFMEEAEDPAEFDASAGGASRGERPERSERSERSDRGGRERGGRDGGAPVRREPSDAELFTSAVAGLEPGRPVIEGERTDGDRDRGRRGGRNRGGRDRGGRGDSPRVEQAVVPPVELAGNISIPEETDEVGEGLPGADGSRRWRGRRGRRGGRGPGAEAAAPVSHVGPIENAYGDADEPFVERQPDIYAGQSSEPEGFEMSAAAVPNGNRDRGGRDRNGRDRGGRGGRDRGGERGPARVPRGFAPKTALYQVDSTDAPYGVETEVEAPMEPIILPGESLRKYRPASEVEATEVKAEAAPVSDFVAAGWDGGLVLPGETIRPRGPVAGSGASFDRPREDRGARDGRDRGRGGRDSGRRDGFRRDAERATVLPVVEAAPAEDLVQAESEVPVVHSTFVPPPPIPVVHEVVAEPELEEIVKEYEPEEASASFRIDPVPPQEFRQAAPVEPEVEVVEEAHEVTEIHADGVMESEPIVADAEAAAEEHEEGAVEEFRAGVPTFEPGMGVLEEELLEEDDEPLVLESLQARGLVEDDVLVDAPDLGLMLEDISLDELASGQRLLDEDDDEDFEEDLLEEGQDFGGADDLDEEEDGEEESLEEIGGEDEVEIAEGGVVAAQPAEGQREPRRDRERGRDGRGRDGRGRDGRGRDRDRGGRSSSGGRERSSGGRDGGGRDGGRGRQTAQATNLPAISDLLKPGQEILVQIAKEPIAKKGARITSHIALPGRFLVFMPTVSHTGVSRKIESDAERRRLKEILLSERGEATGGFIVRTAAAGASEEELRSDLRFLLNLWSDIKARSESSKSPALIYHDLNLIERVLRDQVTDNFSAIWVDSETEYERVLRFLQRFQPSLIRRVKLYTKETPLFEQFGITEEINKALRSKVWLKSGGSIVINQTEALVAIDINTGKFVGKTARLEDTIVKTNLDAIPEIVRQIRLRDLGGIIIIDFIDMDERRNRNKVMQALEDELKLDRAPSKVLQFNDFGLVAITRKRVKQSLERTLSTTCGVCQGTGMVKSPVTVCNDIYVEMKKMAKHLDRGDVMLRVHPEVVKALKAPSTHWLQELEEMCGKTVLVKSDPSLHPEQFDIH